MIESKPESGPQPFIVADLPERPHGFWKLVGPGAVLVGLAIGAGELIVWPIMTARFGASVAWGAMAGILLQLIINIEIGRYTLATGESTYAAFARLGRAWVPVFLALNVLGWILPGWARTCAGAVKALVVGPAGPGEPWVWTALTFAVVALVLFGPKHVYRYVEIITIALVLTMLVALVAIAIRIGTLDAVAELARGILRVGYKPPELPAYEMFSAIVFAGAGGTANLMFSYYLRDKGWGMGAHIVDEVESNVGYAVADSTSNLVRWKQWFGHMVKDQVLFFWIMNSATILLFIFAALVVLTRAGVVPDQEMLVLQEANMMAELLGPAGLPLFLVIGIACLFSTQLTLLDGVSRSCADLIHANYRWARRFPLRSWYHWIAFGWMVAGTVLTWAWSALPPFVFLLSAGFFGGIAMACYCPLILFANVRLLPPACRPSLPWRIALSLVAAFYIAFAVASAYVVTQRLYAGL